MKMKFTAFLAAFILPAAFAAPTEYEYYPNFDRNGNYIGSSAKEVEPVYVWQTEGLDSGLVYGPSYDSPYGAITATETRPHYSSIEEMSNVVQPKNLSNIELDRKINTVALYLEQTTRERADVMDVALTRLAQGFGNMSNDVRESSDSFEYAINNLAATLAHTRTRVSENEKNIETLGMMTYSNDDGPWNVDNGVYTVDTEDDISPMMKAAVVVDESAELEKLQTAVENVQANTAALTQNINNLNTTTALNAEKISRVEEKVGKLDEKLQSGLAAQAALSGLFQPYHVGKLNVTAALGGYQSKTAVAIGSGYRFNERLAAKAGVSFANGRNRAVSYNAAVNYEW